ncbi:uncharacterized protein K02A2.6-like isoform X3 [Amphibalanus amphitrite]|nr:uncharacterized protein K02A2.6-like isoform X3 [Amphibalanus amphitrite]
MFSVSGSDAVTALKEKYAEVFRPGLGELKGVKVKLDIDSSVAPKFYKPRPLPFALKKRVDEQLKREIDMGVLEPVGHAAWGAPIVPVLKSDGSVRICGNFKLTANRAIRVDKYPLPRIEDLFASLAGGKVFTKLDLSQAYQQCVVDEDCRDVLTINTHLGPLRYRRLGFGVNSAVALFQREMEKLLNGMPGVCVFLDDVLITGKSQNDCLQRTSAVLEKLQDAGLRVSEKKCKFCVDSVEYLGHRIDAEGCHPTEAKSLEEEFALDSSRIAALTSRDTLLSRVRQAIETGEWPDEEDIRSFFHRRDELSVIRGVLLWGSRVVVPAKAQKHVLHELHEGHPGVRPPGHHRLGQRSGLHRGGVPAVHEEERHPSCEDGSSQAGVRQSLRQRLRELTGLVARSGRLSPRCNDGGGPAGRWSTVAPSLRSAAVCGRLCSEESHGDGRLRLRTAAGEAGPGGWRAGRGLVGGRSAGGSRGDLGPETGG